jgi:isopenicillin-N N-acyltransferase like protein
MSPIPFLTVAGSAHDRGFAHGRRFAREIADNIETYLRCFAASGLDRAEARAEAGHWRAAIASANPAYAEEMRGIAHGAAQSEENIALLNARYELAFSLLGKEAMQQGRVQERIKAPADGCTTFGLLPQVTADGHAWLGQNWDWLEGVHGRTFVLRVERTDKPSFVCLTEAGIAGGKMGVNECGIGLVENGLAASADGSHPYCKPFHVRCREVLDAQTLDEAMLAPFDAPRTCSANFMLGAGGGEIVDIETSPDHASRLYAQDGIITHSNHFLSQGHGESLLEKIAPNTLHRVDRICALLAKHRGAVSFAHMRAAAKDHSGAPYGICRHPDPDVPASRRTMTVGAVLIDLDARMMHVANGPPCSNEYVAFGVARE